MAFKLYSNPKIAKMAKLYTQETPKQQNLQPKKETIEFILNYSKALSVINCKNEKFELLLN